MQHLFGSSFCFRRLTTQCCKYSSGRLWIDNRIILKTRNSEKPSALNVCVGMARSSVGYSLLCRKEKMINLEPDRVMVGNGPSFGCVLMKDFLELLAKKVKKNTCSFDNYMRMYIPPGVPLKQKENEPIKTLTLFKHIQVSLWIFFRTANGKSHG